MCCSKNKKKTKSGFLMTNAVKKIGMIRIKPMAAKKLLNKKDENDRDKVEDE